MLDPLPYDWESGFYNTHFVKASNQYNNILSLGGVGIDNERMTTGWDVIMGAHSVRLSGRTYHYIPASNTRGGIQYFLHDGRNVELAAHGRERDVDVPTLEKLFGYLQQNNPLCLEYRAIGTMAKWEMGQKDATTFSQEELNDLIPQLNRETVEFDVSSIMIDRSTGNHVLRVALKGSGGGGFTDIKAESELFEPIGYPVLFPHGEKGWGQEFQIIRNGDGTELKISLLDYLASRMLMPEKGLRDCTVNMEPTEEEMADPSFGRYGHWCTTTVNGVAQDFFFPCNRFERYSRLGQIYLVDQMSRAIDMRLDHLRKNQAHILGGGSLNSGIADNSDDEQEHLEDDHGDAVGGSGAQQQYARNSRPTFLPDAFAGSKRHLKKQAVNALHLVTELGSSHLSLL